ncbi:MAG: hypothetical protein ACPG4W_03965 [Flavobacteriales bacterium]
MKITLIPSLFGILLMFSCISKNNNPTPSPCDKVVLVSSVSYENSPDALIHIDTLEIDGNCLSITYNSSGCDGQSWLVELIDSESVMESFPPQRHVRLSLYNPELCLAQFSKTETFDISELQVEGSSSVKLIFTNTDDEFLYSY